MTEYRKKLKVREGERFRFCATVSRFGQKSGFKGPIPTVLLTDVIDAKTKDILTDHLWLTVGKWTIGLKVNDVIAFNARIGTYIKGYLGR